MFFCCAAVGGQQAEVLQVPSPGEQEGESLAITPAAVAAHKEEKAAEPAHAHVEAVPATAAPGPKSPTFEVELDKAAGGGRFGMDLDSTSAMGLQVLKISGGAVLQYNEKAPEHHKIQAHDFLVAVNSAHEPQEMIKELRASGVVKVKVIRPVEMKITVKSGRLPLGLRLSYQENTSACVEIKTITEGAVKAHNTTASAEQQVREGDFIKGVNGVIGSAPELVEQIKGAELLELMILRVIK